VDVIVVAKDDGNNEARTEFRIVIMKDNGKLMQKDEESGFQQRLQRQEHSSENDEDTNDGDDNNDDDEPSDNKNDGDQLDEQPLAALPAPSPDVEVSPDFHLPFETLNHDLPTDEMPEDIHTPFSHQVRAKGDAGWIAEARNLLNCLLVV
jgi:hypothetical protein